MLAVTPSVLYGPAPWPTFNITQARPDGGRAVGKAVLSTATYPLAAAYSVAVNAADEVLVTGLTDGTVDFGGGAVGGSVLLKLDAAGEVISSHTIRAPFDRITLDPAGGIFVAGPSGLAKLDEDGTKLWSVAFDPPSSDSHNRFVEDIAVSPNGTVAITGSTRAPVDFGTGPIPTQRRPTSSSPRSIPDDLASPPASQPRGAELELPRSPLREVGRLCRAPTCPAR